MGGARALRLAQSAAMPDPVLAQDMINFMRECINPELVISPLLVNSIMTSTNIWNDLGPTGIGVLNPGRMVTLSGATGAVQCDDAYANFLGPRLAPAATSEFARIAQILSPSATPATANTMLAALLPASEGLIMTASATTAEAIRQRMMLNMLNDTSANMAQVMNDPSAAQTALGSAMATSNANSAYSVMAKLAQETLPLVRNSIELVVLGVFPIVLILIIVAGSKGGLVLRSYVMTMLWVQLWAPLYAIVNYVGMMAGAKSMKAALAGVNGVSVTNAAQLLNTTISAEAIAGMLTISVPMIALAIVKGGEVAMAGITSGITGPADRAASKVGEQVGSGNVAMGNTSWGNFNANNSSANKTNTAFGYASPNRGDIQTEFGSMTMRGSQAGTPNAIGNLQAEFGNIGVSGGHGAKVEAAKIGSSGDRADLTTGMTTGLQQRSSGQFTHQQGAAAASKIQKALEEGVGGDWSWISKDGAGRSQGTTDRIGTTTRNSHSSNMELGGQVNAKAGGDVSANNPVHSAQDRRNSQAAGHILNGDPHAPVAPGANTPAPAAVQQLGAAPTAAAHPDSLLQGGSPGAVTSAAPGASPAGATPKGSASDLGDKATRAAQQLGQAPSKSSYGVGAGYGFGTKDAEGKDWSAERGNSSEIQQRAEKNFDKASKAIQSLMGKTSNSGERAAMESFLGSLSRSTDATYGTSTQSSLTHTASDTNQHNSGSGASYQVNDNGRYGAAALDSAGGNGARALQQAVTNPEFLNKVGSSVGEQVAGETVPAGGQATGMDGKPIESPKTVAAQHQEGDASVQAQRPKDQAAARGAGNANMREAAGHRAPIGAPTSTAMPSQAPAQQEFNEHKGQAERGLSSTQERAAVSGGLNRASEAIFADKGGMGRLLDASLGFGLFGQAQTLDEVRAPLQQLADSDKPSRDRLAAIGKSGRASEADIEFLAERGKIMNIK